MDWREIAAFVAVNLAILGIIGKMVSGKVNKSECDLKHEYLKKSINNIETNIDDQTRYINNINLTLAKMNGSKDED